MMIQKLFLDTNVVVDLLGERDPFYDAISKITTLADKGRIELVVSSLTFATTYYLLSRFENRDVVKEKIRKFKVIIETADLTNQIIEKGLSSKFPDFEDSLQYYCALATGCNLIITRNGKDFKESAIPVLSPKEYLLSLRV
ncbi:type II toxin-antitoxin system VapC family toxin [Belliella pelovolcani]|uniref:type II toxin-antitoxin system VapC family toxin n=1 Tax=Belliella pelovolcani TaxID=529505 RepID=UPI00391921CB